MPWIVLFSTSGVSFTKCDFALKKCLQILLFCGLLKAWLQVYVVQVVNNEELNCFNKIKMIFISFLFYGVDPGFDQNVVLYFSDTDK